MGIQVRELPIIVSPGGHAVVDLRALLAQGVRPVLELPTGERIEIIRWDPDLSSFIGRTLRQMALAGV